MMYTLSIRVNIYSHVENKLIFIQAWTDEIKHCYQKKKEKKEKRNKPGQFSQAAMAAMCTCKEKGSFVKSSNWLSSPD